MGISGREGSTLSVWQVCTSSSMSSTRTMPNFLHSASNALSEPERLPVWDEATRLPAELRPTFSITMGFLMTAARRSTAVNFSGSLTPSR